jgi:hypothetical protein
MTEKIARDNRKVSFMNPGQYLTINNRIDEINL